MTRLSKKFIIAGIAIIAITTVISRCKTKEEPKVAETTQSADSTIVAKPSDTLAAVHGTKHTPTQVPLTVVVQNLESNSAPVYISIYGTKNKFPEPKGQIKEYKFMPHGDELTVELPSLQFGTYAIASYQDMNSNGKIDKNFIGIPTEGYGFSNNYKPKTKAPNFKDCSFAYNAEKHSVSFKLIHKGTKKKSKDNV